MALFLLQPPSRAGQEACIVAESVAVAPSQHPNVVIILVDDMGFGDARCFNGQSKIPTPAIDSLAAEGMKFTDAHAPGPLCHLSRYGLLTGQYPFRANPAAWKDQPTIAKGQTTIASCLQKAGYQTAMVGKWHLGFKENGYENRLPGGPVDRGFDSFYGIRASTDIPPYFYIRDRQAVMPPTDHIDSNNSKGWSRIQGAFWREGGISPNLKLPDVLPEFTNEAISVIEEHASRSAGEARPKPLMMYLAYPAPHTPWLPSEEFVGKSQVGMYGDFMMMVDAEVGRILNTLDKANMKEDTLVIFTSDNGPCWYEEDDERFQHDSSGGFRGMKADAWEGGHRMPFVCRWPAKVKPGTSSKQMICFTDILATLADMIEMPLEDNEGPDSFSFYPELTGTKRTEQARTEFVMETGSKLKMIRSISRRHGDWKLIDGLGSGGFTKPSRVKPTALGPTAQLYDLKNDPGELSNQLEDPNQQSRHMKAKLDARMSQIMKAKSHRLLVDSEVVGEVKSP
ncbi:MAG: sulfatase-like hydrolase/transferase [Fuerstiella sp.]